MLDRLGASRAALAASLRSQQRLIADASHELRTPVTSLRTNAEVLRDATDLSEADRAALLDDVVAQTEELGELVVGHHRARPRRRPRRGGRGRAPRPARRGGRRARAPPRARRRVRHDARAVRRRGARPTGSGAPSTTCSTTRRSTARPAGSSRSRVARGELTVRDHGPGVAPEDAPHVFDRFYRGAGARDRPGSGLGLAIVRQVAEAHGGAVAVEDAPGGGALFRLDVAVRGRPRTSPAAGARRLPRRRAERFPSLDQPSPPRASYMAKGGQPSAAAGRWLSALGEQRHPGTERPGSLPERVDVREVPRRRNESPHIESQRGRRASSVNG